MKTLLLLLMATAVCLAQDLKYESQKKGCAVNTKHLKAFSNIKLAHVKIKKSHFSDAIFYLSKGAEDKNKIGHFDFGVAYPVDINDSAGLFTESREEKLKYDTLVSLNKKE